MDYVGYNMYITDVFFYLYTCKACTGLYMNICMYVCAPLTTVLVQITTDYVQRFACFGTESFALLVWWSPKPNRSKGITV